MLVEEEKSTPIDYSSIQPPPGRYRDRDRRMFRIPEQVVHMEWQVN
jgi:hypothetical protein